MQLMAISFNFFPCRALQPLNRNLRAEVVRNFKLGLVEDYFNNKKRLKKCSDMRKINFYYCERSSESIFMYLLSYIQKKIFLIF